MKLTPEHDQPVYTQSPPTPIHLREELQVELALLQYFGIITSLNHSNIVAQFLPIVKQTDNSEF